MPYKSPTWERRPNVLAAPLILGGLVAVTVLGGLHGAPLSLILVFGTVALLYLVTEELLVEAHERSTAQY